MKRLVPYVAAFILTFSSAHAFNCASRCDLGCDAGCRYVTVDVEQTCTPHEYNCCARGSCFSEYFNAYFGSGYREDNFNFNVAEEGGIPNVAREIKWEKIQIVPVWGYVDYRHPCGFVVKFYGDYGRIFDGDAVEKQWAGNDRTLLILENKSNAGRQEVWDIGGGLGYSIKLYGELWTITPLIGFDLNSQRYRIYETEQVFGPNVGMLPGQHNSMFVLWRGPWAGIETKMGPWLCTDLWVKLGYDYHYMYYWARLKDTYPDYILGSETDCFQKQNTHAHGNHAWASIDYYCTRQWSIGVRGDYLYYVTKKGIENTTCTNNATNVSTYTKENLNKATWTSFSLLITLGFHY